MFGFPIPLYDSGNSPVKMTMDFDSGFPKSGVREIFYSIKTGNWSDTNIWQTASGRVGLLPSTNDDVYIRHNVTCDVGGSTEATATKIHNLFVIGTLSASNVTTNRMLYILGDCQIRGTLDMTASTFGMTLVLHSDNNRIDNLISGTLGTIAYNGSRQRILPLTYRNLTIASNEPATVSINGFTQGLKYLIADTTVLGNLVVGTTSGGIGTGCAVFEVGQYTLTVNGTTTTGYSLWKSTMKGTMIFGGNVDMSGSSFKGIQWSDTTCEFRGGLDMTGQGISSSYAVWGGTASFTTSNQNFSGYRSTLGTINIDATITIASGITITQPAAGATGGAGRISLTSTMNGAGSTSSFINKSIVNFATQTAADNSMSTGTFNVTGFSNTIEFNGNYSTTINATRYASLSSLTIGGTGTKTLGINTTLSGAFINNGTIALSTYNFTVTSTSTLGANSTFTKSGSGSILFGGELNFNSGGVASQTFDLSGGNPTVECRGGIQLPNGTPTLFNSGTNTWTFSTNNQSIRNLNGAGSSMTLSFVAPILISGAITLTIDGTNGSALKVSIDQPINGNNASSTLSVKGILSFRNSTAAGCMTTGIFDSAPTTTNTFAGIEYDFAGNYTLPSTTYNNLYITNVTGTKSLSGNTTCNRGITLGIAAGTLECSTYNLTTSGAVFVNTNFTLSKNGAGNLIFGGLFTVSNNGFLSLNGNPTVELQGGLTFGQNVGGNINMGTGQWKFTTNNQNFSYGASSTDSLTFNGSLLISGAITITYQKTLTGVLTFISQTIDGDNVNSKLVMGSGMTINYKSSTKPFATNGILDTSTNPNTWIYGNGNQDILGGASVGAKQVYRNLTLNGSGTKTLQGYVSVLNTYTLTSPATLNNNGYTLTNP